MQIVALAQIIWARCPSSAAADAVENFGPPYVTAAATASAVVKVSAVSGNDAGCLANATAARATIRCATIQGGIAAAQKAEIYTVALLADGVHYTRQAKVWVTSPLAIVGYNSLVASVGGSDSTARPIVDCG